ncbi:MAG: hypothetical protein HC831_01735 [Chloroflexia bacterium]|nr:hypothetical protein [Chloroflexia bacterium]
MKIILFSLGLILTGFYSNAQVISRHNDRNALKLIRKTNKKAPVTKLKGIDIVNILKEDSIDRVKGLPKRFGKSNNVNLDIDKNGIWTSDELGRVWELSIHSKGAHSLNLIFDKFKLPTGASLIIYNEDTSFILGPITHEANNKYNRYSTDLIKGDFATIQLFEPWNQKGKTKLSVSNIIHGYVNIFSGGFGQSESCNNDIACHNDWEIESQAIALVILDNGTRLCSGSLVNTGCNDFQPYFLTAFHCLDSWADGNLSLAERNDTQNWVFRYNYTSPSCNGPDGVQYVSYSGADFISAWAETDFALVELSNQPNHQEVAYAGWERDGVNPTSSVGIHHHKEML